MNEYYKIRYNITKYFLNLDIQLSLLKNLIYIVLILSCVFLISIFNYNSINITNFIIYIIHLLFLKPWNIWFAEQNISVWLKKERIVKKINFFFILYFTVNKSFLVYHFLFLYKNLLYHLLYIGYFSKNPALKFIFITIY